MRAIDPNASRSALDKLVRDAGIKDTLAQPIIESLLQLGHELCNQETEVGRLSAKRIQELLNEELRRISLQGPIQNPLLDMEGMFH